MDDCLPETRLAKQCSFVKWMATWRDLYCGNKTWQNSLFCTPALKKSQHVLLPIQKENYLSEFKCKEKLRAQGWNAMMRSVRNMSKSDAKQKSKNVIRPLAQNKAQNVSVLHFLWAMKSKPCCMHATRASQGNVQHKAVVYSRPKIGRAVAMHQFFSDSNLSTLGAVFIWGTLTILVTYAPAMFDLSVV